MRKNVLREFWQSAQGMIPRRANSLHFGLAVVVGSSALVAGGMNATPVLRVAQVAPQTPSEVPDSLPPGDTRFSCEVMDGEYTVVYSPQSQPGQLYPWATPRSLGGGWSADLRCAEISRRLESYRPDGLLELQTAVENGYNTICVTTEDVPTCRIVLTVPPGQDPIATRNSVFANLATADTGEQTSAVATFSDGDGAAVLNQIGEAIGFDLSSITGRRQREANRASAIDLRPFLDPMDGGTGTMLR